VIPGAPPDSPVSLLDSIQRLVGHTGKFFNTRDKDLTPVDPFQIHEDHHLLLPYLCHLPALHPGILTAHDGIDPGSCHRDSPYVISYTAFMQSKTLAIGHSYYRPGSPRNPSRVIDPGEHSVWQHRPYRYHGCITGTWF
jgi:hypothetical protein